jgi:uncharacterized UBP type Zn finger protein
MLRCPECGGQVITGGGCWACLACGAEGCGRLEVSKKDAETHNSRTTNLARRTEA